MQELELGLLALTRDSSYRPLLAITSVCKRWRTIAIHSPELWSHISFREHPPFPLARMWLARSGSYPLMIHINTNPSKPAGFEITMDDLEMVIDLITPTMDRWSTFDFSTQSAAQMNAVIGSLNACSSLPLLESLVLRGPSASRTCTVDLHRIAPTTLSSLALDGVLPTSWKDWPFLSALEVLVLARHAFVARPQAGALAAILRGSPLLRKLSLCLSGPHPFDKLGFISYADWLEQGVVCLPELRELKVISDSAFLITAVLCNMAMPFLTSLVVNLGGAGDYSELLDFWTAPQHEQSSLFAGLRHFAIQYLKCDGSRFDSLLRALLNVRVIMLNVTHASLLHRLAQPEHAIESNGCVCPKLVALHTRGVSSRLVWELLKSRVAANAPLKTVFITDALFLDDEVAAIRGRAELLIMGPKVGECNVYL